MLQQGFMYFKSTHVELTDVDVQPTGLESVEVTGTGASSGGIKTSHCGLDQCTSQV